MTVINKPEIFSTSREDDFYINDTKLIIPAEQIAISRNSFLNDWQTMRTAAAHRTKSGHSLVNISFPVPFQGNESINLRLRPLVAGLRAFPFCVVKNKYLSDQLGELGGANQAGSKYTQFKPVSLVLNSMTLSTVPGSPDTLLGQFQFMWFNYLPYTPIWAYKTGGDFETPGSVDESILWQLFYKPFLDETEPVSWPHVDSSLEKCLLRYRDFTVQWGGRPDAIKAAQELVNIIKNNPKEAFGTLKDVLGNDTINLSNSVLTNLYNKLAEKGVISKANSKLLENLQAGGLEKASADVLLPLIKRIYPHIKNAQDSIGSIINENKMHIDAAGAELATRWKRARQAAKSNIATTWEEIKEFSKDIVINNKAGTKISVGGYKIYGKKRNIQVSTLSPGGQGAGFVLEGMSITFAPSLAIIPMVGHSHPTCQFMGGYNTELSLSINATNDSIKTLAHAYDRWEDNNLRFRKIPQGFRNVEVDCDFVRLFGIREFIPKELSTETIPSQPGRSRGTLVFVDAGITSLTQFDDPEKLNQEYIPSSHQLRREVYNIIEKATKEKADNTGRVEVSADADLRNSQFFKAVLSSAVYYNDLADRATKAIFYLNGTASTKTIVKSIGGSNNMFKGMTGWQIYQYMMNLSQSSPDEFGFIPGLERLQRHLTNIKRKAGMSKNFFDGFNVDAKVLRSYISDKLGRKEDNKKAFSLSEMKKSAKNKDFANYLETPEGQKSSKSFIQEGLAWYQDMISSIPIIGKYSKSPLLQKETPLERQTRLLKTMGEIGLGKYSLQMRDLLDRLIKNPPSPQMDSIREIKEKNGIGKGKPAYPDFKPHLMSVVSFLDGNATDSSLLDYDPDIFLWYPLYNGALSSPLNNVITDPMTINKAKQHSLMVFDNAQKSLGDFFKTTYMDRMGGTANPAPLKALKHYSKGKLAEPLYANSVYKNSTLNADEGGESKNIKVSVVPDPGKLPVNWYGSKKIDIVGNGALEHSTDMGDLWDPDSVKSETGTAIQDKEPSGEEESYDPPSFGNVTITSKANKRMGILPFTTEFSPEESSSQTPKNGLVCPVETYSLMARNQSLGFRDIGMSGVGKTQIFGTRARGAIKNWLVTKHILKKHGCVDPRKAPFHPAIKGKSYYGKPVRKWTVVQYMEWRRKTGSKMGYLHKGLDLFVSRKSFHAGIPTKVYAIADSVVYYATPRPGVSCGLFVILRHPGKPNGVGYSRYLHLQAIAPWVKKGKRLSAGDVIGVVGKSGTITMRPHLHFEVWKNNPLFFGRAESEKGGLLNPLLVDIPWRKSRHSSRKTTKQAKQRLSTLSKQTLEKDVTTTTTSPLREAIKEFEKRLLKGQAQRLIRALPTFKLYFIEDDSGQRKRLAFDDFYSYNAVQSIRIVKSRKIAADLCVIELTNISGTLSNRKFKHQKDGDKARDFKGNVVNETKALDSPMNANTADENPIASLLLQTGIDIHVKMGYSNDPNILDPVFTGKIQSVEFSETDDLITLVAQSHATELVQDIKGIEKPSKKSTFGLGNWNIAGFGDNATTGRIFEEMLAQPEVIHFGRWKRGDSTANRELLTNKYQFVANPQDDNIFAPPPGVDLATFGEGTFFKELAYWIYRTTIWDIFKEMEMRHPNFIGSPVPYSDGNGGERMTYFFGLPNQMYFARNPRPEEQDAQDKIKKEAEAVEDDLITQVQKQTNKIDLLRKILPTAGAIWGMNPWKILETYDAAIKTIIKNSPISSSIRKGVNKIYRKKRLSVAREAGYIKPFRNYHLFTSQSHIIANNIRADSKGVANTIAIVYPKTKVNVGLVGTTSIQSKETFILKLDNALPTEEIRTQIGEYYNVFNEELAKRYALTSLIQNIKDIYKGDLVVIGEPTLQPYDIVYLFDEYSDMVGPVEVEQVIHYMHKDVGYICEITPDMVVMASEWSLLGCVEALSIVMEGTLKKVWGKDVVNANKTVFAPWTYMMSRSVNLLGGMTAKKLVHFTQLGQPVVMVPLLHNGKEFSGGIPTRKIPTSMWNTMFGEWKPEADKTYNAWLEDWGDSVSRSIKKATGGYSVGSVLDGWSSNTIDDE